jgi:hypothetical protein
MNQDVIPAGESTAVAIRSASPFDGNVTEFKGALVRRGENRNALIEWIRGALVAGVDFGKIHTGKKRECRHGGPPSCTPEVEPRHWSKDSLRKPGAEKICGMLGVLATFPTIKDYEAAALDGRPIESIILRCHLLAADGSIIADGIGARSVAQDYGDLNKALKMACKSAHVDATLRMAGLSEIFTQDLEDMKAAEEVREREARDRDGGHEPQHEPHNQQQQRRPAPAAKKPATQAPRSTGGGGRGLATEKQVMLIERRLGDAQIDPRDLCEHFEINAVVEIPFGKVNEALDWISNAPESAGADEPQQRRW